MSARDRDPHAPRLRGGAYEEQGFGTALGLFALDVFRATVLAVALRDFVAYGKKLPFLKPSKYAAGGYSIEGIMRAAEKITHKKFKKSDYLGAADALCEWRDRNARRVIIRDLKH